MGPRPGYLEGSCGSPHIFQLLFSGWAIRGPGMKRTVICVDAGYLFAQGSVALSGTKRPRSVLILDPPGIIDHLVKFAAARIPEFELLRIYWYDGASGLRPTIEQEQLAHLDNVKVRLGLINSAGQQKGVDSLIVTDLIELARLGAICDAVLLSGDEDVRVGVQIAQNYGVRVHLLGIEPSRGSQSKALLQEADTTGEWTKATVARFLSIRSSPSKPEAVGPVAAVIPPAASSALTSSDVPADPSITQQISSAADDFVHKLSDADVKSLLTENPRTDSARIRWTPPDAMQERASAQSRCDRKTVHAQEVRRGHP
jgi:NYN domain